MKGKFYIFIRQSLISFFRYVGFLPPVQVVMIVLKLTGAVGWSWWVVFVPTLIFIAFVVWIFVGLFLSAFYNEFKIETERLQKEDKEKNDNGK